METVTTCYRVAKRDIAFIRFILEAYEGVAVLRTIDPERGVVALHQAPDSVALAARIIEELRKDIRIEDAPGAYEPEPGGCPWTAPGDGSSLGGENSREAPDRTVNAHR